MAFLFQKFQEAVKVLAKSPTFAKEGRHLQFEADINKLFLFTRSVVSHNRLGKKADADEIIEIIEMASKASLVEQQKQPNLMTVYSGTAVAETKLTKRCDVSQKVKDLLGHTLEVKPFQIQDKDAGQGLFLDGEADLAREMWDGSSVPRPGLNAEGGVNGSDWMWKLLGKPLDGSNVGGRGVVLGRRNPLAFAHFSNHPSKDMLPNVMSWKSSSTVADAPIIKSLVPVATRGVSNEEILLNYRLSNLKCQPSWYTPVDEEEDRRRWS
ncbi:hypothetical protein C2S52_008143 [Perilla frutescens var. hirtella]|nr:hypothetical protein C2S52_008143 [Perilla frutescens var. hirtella]